MPGVVTEAVIPTPEGSYGAEKLICETLVNEYTRRKFVDAFILRFPTITVRPGKPTAAASRFISGIIREPLNGQECIVPLEDRAFPSWVYSPKTLTHNLLHALKLPSDAMPPHIRVVNAPGISVTIQEMMDALEKVGGKDKLGLVKEKHDPDMARILYSWGQKFDNALAYKLGYRVDSSFEQAVRDYKDSLI
jgi:nucleoside-diphosphate-sugar epimerase